MSIKEVYLLNSFDALFTKKLMANTCAAAFLHKLEDQDADRAEILQYINTLTKSHYSTISISGTKSFLRNFNGAIWMKAQLRQ